MNDEIILTQDQENAMQSFIEFLNSDERFMIIEGFAGVGKTTLVKHILKYLKFLESLGTIEIAQPILTATTNKACSALEDATDTQVKTIHKYLDLYLQTNYQTGESILKRKKVLDNSHLKDKILFIDEASYIDKILMQYIVKLSTESKVVFMGDPNQLLPVKCNHSPVFSLDCRKALLTKVVRQADDNPIQKVCQLLRNTIQGDSFPSITLDEKHLIHLDRASFNNSIIHDYKDWTPDKCRILSWTNNTVHKYNNLVLNNVLKRDTLIAGDYVINNHYIPNQKGFHTDAVLKIQKITPDTLYGEAGYLVTAKGFTNFMPSDKAAKKKLQKHFRDVQEYTRVEELETWLDLRPPFASTINKAQGSTFDHVYIDLDDLAKCKQANQLARLLYVAISRAKNKVIFTGDIA